MSADTILIKYFFLFIFAIFSKLVKSEPYLAILLFYNVNLTTTVAKFPTFFSNFLFYKNCFPSPYLSRAVCPVKISHKNLVQANVHTASV